MMPRRESVVTSRAVQVKCIPDGTPLELPEGTAAQLTQALGSSFSLVVGGQLVQLKGADADAIGREVPVAPHVPDDVKPEELRSIVWQILKTCYDPEIPVDIVELGLIYVCDVLPVEEGQFRVSIKMTLTAPGCGMGEILVDEITDKVRALPHVSDVDVEMVFDPPWNLACMSEGAQLALGL